MVKINFTALDRLLEKMGVDTLADLKPMTPISYDGVTAEDMGKYIMCDPTTGAMKFRDSDDAPILYIKAPSSIRSSFSDPKFHFLWCNTIEGKFRSKQLNRYVLVSAKDEVLEHMFTLHKHGKHINKELKVCQNCLKKLNQEWGIRIYFNQFKLPDVLGKYQVQLKQRPVSELIIPRKGGYSKHWSKTSADYRKSKNWICEKCELDLKNDTDLLHAHHIDRNTQNDKRDNLKALCIACHAQEHPHMDITQTELIRIKELRRQQFSLND